jgi:hypothetical protein
MSMIKAFLQLSNHFTEYDEICYSVSELKNCGANLILINFLHPLKKFSLCLTNYAQRHEDVLQTRCIDPSILDLDTSSR